MVQVHNTNNLIEITITKKLTAETFHQLSKTVDPIIQKHRHVYVIIDAVQFAGWKDWQAIKAHFHFVRQHHAKINKLAIIGKSKIQLAIVNIIRFFVHPTIKVFYRHQLTEAKKWLNKP